MHMDVNTHVHMYTYRTQSNFLTFFFFSGRNENKQGIRFIIKKNLTKKYEFDETLKSS